MERKGYSPAIQAPWITEQPASAAGMPRPSVKVPGEKIRVKPGELARLEIRGKMELHEKTRRRTCDGSSRDAASSVARITTGDREIRINAGESSRRSEHVGCGGRKEWKGKGTHAVWQRPQAIGPPATAGARATRAVREMIESFMIVMKAMVGREVRVLVGGQRATSSRTGDGES